MKPAVVIRELNHWPWGYRAVRYNAIGAVAWQMDGSHLKDVRREAELQAKIHKAELIIGNKLFTQLRREECDE